MRQAAPSDNRLRTIGWLLALLVITLTGNGQPIHPGRLAVAILDAATDRPTPVRVRLTRAGRVVPVVPPRAASVQYGLWDHADGYAFQPDSAFYVAGRFTLQLPPGTYELWLRKGTEYLEQRHIITVGAGQSIRRTYRLTRWGHAAARGWYSADGHIHIRRSPRENPLLLTWTQAEDIHVGVLLGMGDFWETYYPQYAYGRQGLYGAGAYVLAAGQEDPRTPELGHALGIGADRLVRYRDDYYAYDRVFDELHRRGGLTGYAHQAESFHGYRGLTLDGLRGKVDLVELLQYCVSEQPLRPAHYYHLLDLGYRLTATAGSDFPWCGHDHDHGPPERLARIGNARFYTYLNGPFSYDAWLTALRAGHTVVSSGPLLDLTVQTTDGRRAIPGDSLTLRSGERLTLRAQALGHPAQVPLDTLELIGHGRVLARVTGRSAARLNVTASLDSLTRGIWLAARCVGRRADGTWLAAHTTPVYVTVGSGGFHNPATVELYLARSEAYLRELEAELSPPTPPDNPERRAWYHQKALRERIAQTRQLIDALRRRLK